jgi:hypothetical protein
METAYSILTPTKSFMVIEKGKKLYFVWWLSKNDADHQARTKALISEPANALVVINWGTEQPTKYSYYEIRQKMKKLPPWTTTRYLYAFNFTTGGEIWDLVNKVLLRGEERGKIKSAVDSEIIASLGRSYLAKHKLWGLKFE